MQIVDLNPELETLPDREAAAVQAGLSIDVPYFSGAFDFSSDSAYSTNGYSSKHSTRKSSKSSKGYLSGISLRAPYFSLLNHVISFPGGLISL